MALEPGGPRFVDVVVFQNGVALVVPVMDELGGILDVPTVGTSDHGRQVSAVAQEVAVDDTRAIADRRPSRPGSFSAAPG